MYILYRVLVGPLKLLTKPHITMGTMGQFFKQQYGEVADVAVSYNDIELVRPHEIDEKVRDFGS